MINMARLSNEHEFLRDKEQLQRLQQQEYCLWQRLEQMYRELANIQVSISMSTKAMQICQQNQRIVQNNLLQYKALEASEMLTPTI